MAYFSAPSSLTAKAPGPETAIPSMTQTPSSSTHVHWRGNEHTLFRLSTTAKWDIQSYILGQNVARNRETNELTNPTGTKFVYILRLDEDENEEQEAVCVPTNPHTLAGIYKFREAEPHEDNPEQHTPSSAPTFQMQDTTTRKPSQSQEAMYLARMMASANEDNFHVSDCELDRDSNENGGVEDMSPPPYTSQLKPVSEEDEYLKNGFANVVNREAPKYCHDPYFTGHTDSHRRQKTASYNFSTVNAEKTFRERFGAVHSGGDSIAYYRNWCILKWNHGETMVHGQSPLRNEVRLEDDKPELEDPATLLLDRIEAKYGPLTKQNLASRAPSQLERVKCSEECIFKISKFLDGHIEGNSWHSEAGSDNEYENDRPELENAFFEAQSLNDDVDTTPEKSQCKPLSLVSEDELLKILNTSHNTFVNQYVQRQQKQIEQAAYIKYSCEDTSENAVIQNDVPLSCPANFTLEPALPAAVPSNVEVFHRPTSDLTSHSSCEDLSTCSSIFSKEASVTTELSNETFEFDQLQVIDTLAPGLDACPRIEISAGASDSRHALNMPVSDHIAPDLFNVTTKESPLDSVAPEQLTTDVSAIVARNINVNDEYLSIVARVQAPLPSPAEHLSKTHKNVLFRDQSDSFLLPVEAQLHSIDAWLEAVR